jgi:hypothetical protein
MVEEGGFEVVYLSHCPPLQSNYIACSSAHVPDPETKQSATIQCTMPSGLKRM